MRLLIQRVKTASVALEDGSVSGQINAGLLILIGIEVTDSKEDIDYLSHKVLRLRVFDDSDRVMNLSVLESAGAILVVSQFTLHASTRKGNRPSYIRAARPEEAIPLYDEFISKLISSGLQIETGQFGAMMQISLVNDGPVTIWLDSKNKDY